MMLRKRVVVNFDVIAWFTHNAKLRLIANCRLRDHSRITHYPFTQSLQKLPLPKKRLWGFKAPLTAANWFCPSTTGPQRGHIGGLRGWPGRQGVDRGTYIAGGEYAGEGGVVDLGTFGGALDVTVPVELDASNKMGVLFCLAMLQGTAMRNTPDTKTAVLLSGYHCGKIRCRTSATTLVDTRKLVLLRSCLIAPSKLSHSRSAASAINPKVPITRKPVCSAMHLPSLSSIRTKSAP